MTLALSLLVIGFLVIFLEFFLPGGILAVIGTLLVTASMVLFALSVDSALLTVVYVIGCIIGLCFVVRFALWRIRHSSPNYSVYLDKDQEGYYAFRYDESLLGKNGKVLTELRPGGYVVIEGKKYSAISKSGYISKGAEVQVVGGEEEVLIVQEKS